MTLTVVVAVASQLGALAVNAASSKRSRWPWGLSLVQRSPFLAGAMLTVVIVIGSLLLLWVQHRSIQPNDPRLPEVPGWVVDRSEAVDEVVSRLRRRGGAVGITTGIDGAGGFGKTTVAALVCADRRVRRRFRGGVFFLPVGREVVRPAAVAAKVNDAVELITGERPGFVTPEAAGAHLGRVLDERSRCLLVIDDVWTLEQAAPFLVGGRRCARLITTRMPATLPGSAARVTVDRMTAVQARTVLTRDLELPGPVVVELLAATGRWPLLLRLVNRLIVRQMAMGRNAVTVAGEIVMRLRAEGFNDIRYEGVDAADLRFRNAAVRATIEASTDLLPTGGLDRLTELGIFAEDEQVPVPLTCLLWQATANLPDDQARGLLGQLADLALVTLRPADGGAVELHDVLRSFLRGELTHHNRLAAANTALVDAVAAGLPLVASLSGWVTAWWQMGDLDRYLWEHLIWHLKDTDSLARAEAVAGDLRWITARIQRGGTSAPLADLYTLGSPQARRWRIALGRDADLFSPTTPAEALVDVVCSRVGHVPGWNQQVRFLFEHEPDPVIMNQWPLPDLPHRTLQYTLTGHTSRVNAVAVSPDGAWIVSGGGDGEVRVWDVASGSCRAVLKARIHNPAAGTRYSVMYAIGRTSVVNTVAVSPDGAWIVSGSGDDMVRVWEVATGKCRVAIGHSHWVQAVAVSPDGAWIASGSVDRTVRVSDVTTGARRLTLSHKGSVDAVAVSPDGAWIVSGSDDQTVRMWDMTNGKCRASFVGHTGSVETVAVSPDGAWIVSGSVDRTVRVWDVTTGACHLTLRGHTRAVRAVAVSPDGAWIVSGSDDNTVQVWDVAMGKCQATLTGHTGSVRAVAVSPDGTWIVSGSDDRTVRVWETGSGRWSSDESQSGHTGVVNAVAVSPDGAWIAAGGSGGGTVSVWDVATGKCRAALEGHSTEVNAVAVSPDGTWIAAGGSDGTVQVWDVATRTCWATLTGHTGSVETVAVSPDGTWIATGSDDETVRVWDVATGKCHAALEGHTNWVNAVVVSPDGTWIATGSRDGNVRVWDVASCTCRAILNGYGGSVNAVAVSPDGTWIATGSRDGKVRVWDVASYTCRAILNGHRGSVNAVAVSPDGTRIATGSGDCTVRVWDMGNKRCLTMLRFAAPITACAITFDASQLVVAGLGGLYLFVLKSQKAMRPDN